MSRVNSLFRLPTEPCESGSSDTIFCVASGRRRFIGAACRCEEGWRRLTTFGAGTLTMRDSGLYAQ